MCGVRDRRALLATPPCEPPLLSPRAATTSGDAPFFQESWQEPLCTPPRQQIHPSSHPRPSVSILLTVINQELQMVQEDNYA